MIYKKLIYGLLFVSIYTIEGQNTNVWTPIDHQFPDVSMGQTYFKDINSDGRKDVIISGLEAQYPYTPITKVYLSTQRLTYTQVTNNNLPGVYDGDLAIADIDQDGDQDIFTTGLSKNNKPIAFLALNNGKGEFLPIKSNVFVGLNKSNVCFLDYNNDGYLDILTTGLDQFEVKTILYLNNKQNDFVAVKHPLHHVYDGDVLIKDLNSDGLDDIIISGLDKNRNYVTDLYLNSDEHGFRLSENSGIQPIIRGNIATLDLNDDKYPDLVINGERKYRDLQLEAYINLGEGKFKEVEIFDKDPTGSIYGNLIVTKLGESNKPSIIQTGWDGTNTIARVYSKDNSVYRTFKNLEIPKHYSSIDIDYNPITDYLYAITSGKTNKNIVKTDVWRYPIEHVMEASKTDHNKSRVFLENGLLTLIDEHKGSLSTPEIFDALGRQHIHDVEFIYPNQFRVDQLQKGIYFLKYHKQSYKFIIQ